MAIFTLDNAKLWVEGYDLQADTNRIEGITGVRQLMAGTFGDSGARRKAGLRTLRMSARGFWDSVAVGPQFKPDKVLFDQLGLVDVPISFSPNAGAEGDIGYFAKAALSDVPIQGQVGELLAFSFAAQGSGGLGLCRGTVMHNATRTATGTGTVRQLGATSATQKICAALHVLGVAGTTPTLDVTVKTDDASGFPSPITRVTFAQKTARGAEFAAPVLGPITDDWFRIDWTIGGAGPSFTFVVLVGIVSAAQ